MLHDLLSRAVVPSRLALIYRGAQTVGYNPGRNVWHRLEDDAAEVLRWLRADRDRSALAEHLSRRFSIQDSQKRVEAILQWALLHRLLYLDSEPREAEPFVHRPLLAAVYWVCTQKCNLRCSYCY